MHDIKQIAENPAEFDRKLARRGLKPCAAALVRKDAERRQAVAERQGIQTQINDLSKQIARLRATGADAAGLAGAASRRKNDLHPLTEQISRLEADLRSAMMQLPNLPDDSVPDGADETSNVEIRRLGEQPQYLFPMREHYELRPDLMDFDSARTLAGSRFVALRGDLARLERALGQFMLDMHVRDHGYEEVAPPLLVTETALAGTGQLPKFADDQFQTTDNKWLIPTAEVPLTNLVANKILDAADLPLRFAALTPCFRREAGAAGKDTHGILRQHQFMKCELVSIVEPDDSEYELDRMTRRAERVLQHLDLPYRTAALCAGDLGFAACKTLDIEVWLPGTGAYREISSCSMCDDFQARRMNARYRPKGCKPQFVHTLNGSGVAVGRALAAVLENYQNQDGSVNVPPVLRPYMGGVKQIAAGEAQNA